MRLATTALGLIFGLAAGPAWGAPEEQPSVETPAVETPAVQEASAAAKPQVKPVFMLAGRSRPAGAGVTITLPVDFGPIAAGPAFGLYYYWYELDLFVQKTVLGGFFVGSGWVGWEPGWFIPADDPEGSRVWGPRALARARVEFNLRNDHFWVYTRSTGVFRDRAFPEYDPYRGAVLDTEWSGEQSVALLACPIRQGERRWWLYAELTLEAEAEAGWLERMPRAGLIVEQLVPGVTIDLDVYYSLMGPPLGGLGVLGVVWWSPTLGKRAPAWAPA